MGAGLKVNKADLRRFDNTTKFLKKSIPPPARVLDLGVVNAYSKVMTEEGYQVSNTAKGVDLDIDYSVVEDDTYDVVTAFEIFEHMVAPFNLLRAIKAPQLVASVPLKLWFANAYWNENDPWDRHFHEFESRQFDMLLEKAGWEIIDSEKWISSGKAIGIRPLLRRFTPRYYVVYCKRKRQ